MTPRRGGRKPGMVEQSESDDGLAPRAGLVLVLTAFAAAIFVSAALLFAIEPIFTKMVLPRLGGSASVWSVALVFFQAMLLAGYVYAHAITRLMPGRTSVAVHLAVMGIATFALPLAVAPGWEQPPESGEAFWLIGLFTASIGLPFFALAGNGPLLQAWFARTRHHSAGDPYFLYATSNAGSFIALLAYPFVIEPFTRLGEQTAVWSMMFFALIALIAICGAVIWSNAGGADLIRSLETPDVAHTSWREALAWMSLAAIPSGLLIAVTAHLSTDVAAAPFLWVIPLALYLATFIVVFQRRPMIEHRHALMAQPALLVALVATFLLDVTEYQLPVLALHLVAFFATALVCHGELARRRPAAAHLTAFYMWMSAGGVVGGIFAALVAPHVFNWVTEYPLLLVLSVLCRPGLRLRSASSVAGLALALAAAALALIGAWQNLVIGPTLLNGTVLVLLGIALLCSRDPLKFAMLVALAIMFGRLYEPDIGARTTLRSFFGVHKISDLAGDGDGERVRVLEHGTTIHGAERARDLQAGPPARPEPLTYYHSGSALAQTIAATRARIGGPLRVAVVGLGTGTLACYAQPGDEWRYYEIDPLVVRISRDLQYFNFLARCAPAIPIVLGDARLTLTHARDGSYDLIVVDAFSSDTIPVHLMTKEAMAVYAAKLAPHGMVAMHVSNRYMELISVVDGIAKANELAARTNGPDSEVGVDDDSYKFDSNVVAVARAPEDFGVLVGDYKWIEPRSDPGQKVWTDDYSNVLGAILRQRSN
jgi:hypothetical protein